MVVQRYTKLAASGVAYAHRDLASHLKHIQRRTLDLCEAGAESVRVVNAIQSLSGQSALTYQQAAASITETFAVLQPFNAFLSKATEEIMDSGIMLLSKGQ